MESTKSTSQTNSSSSGVNARRIVFFDGYCNICNQWVDFMLRILMKRSVGLTHDDFQIASLQGNTAKQVMETSGRHDLLTPPFNTMVLYQRVAGTVGEVEFFTESDAILRIFADLGFPWRMMVIFRIVPRFLRDFVYRWIARNRYRFFGKRDECRLPTKEERAWLLD